MTSFLKTSYVACHWSSFTNQSKDDIFWRLFFEVCLQTTTNQSKDDVILENVFHKVRKIYFVLQKWMKHFKNRLFSSFRRSGHKCCLFLEMTSSQEDHRKMCHFARNVCSIKVFGIGELFSWNFQSVVDNLGFASRVLGTGKCVSCLWSITDTCLDKSLTLQHRKDD